MESSGVRRAIALRRGVVKALGVVLLAVAVALAALGIPVPWRRPKPLGRSDTEEVHDAAGPEPPARTDSRL